MKKNRRIIIEKSISRAMVHHANPRAARHFHVRAYRAQLQSLQVANDKMRRFIEVDQVAFTLWWQEEFAAQLGEQMKLESELNELLLLTEAIERYQDHYRGTAHRAYEVVMKARRDGKLDQVMRKIFDEEAALRPPQGEPAPLWRDRSPRLEEAREKPDAASSTHASSPDPTFEAIPSGEETTESYLKKIYREIVRLLHPDSKPGGSLSVAESALWHELQNAYKWKDLGRMEKVLEAVKGQKTAAIDFETIPIGDIIAMKEAISRKLNELRRTIKEAKKEAVWDFSERRQKRSFLSYLAASIENELLEQTMALTFQIDKLKKRLHTWSQASENRKQKGKGSPRERSESSPQGNPRTRRRPAADSFYAQRTQRDESPRGS